MTMPEQKPGRSEQTVCTPPEFLDAVRRRLGIDEFDCDLAADETNTVVPEKFYTEQDDALVQPWKFAWSEGWNWCNPPYADIGPWVEKAQMEAYVHGTNTAMLVPASSGSNWWMHWVDGKAYVTFLNPRIKFVGHKTPYPKDLALLLYAPFLHGGSCVWRWK
jgi:phage N-6-adenine-methyltransferase